MDQNIKVEYCFEKTAKILEPDSEKLMEYSKHFEEDALPEIRKIESEKSSAREYAYQLRVSGFLSFKK